MGNQARKRDHFLTPAGACHSSGANSMVLEISHTPYIVAFKMKDWARPGLNGLLCPINLTQVFYELAGTRMKP